MKNATGQIDYGARRFCKLNKKPYSAAALFRWGKWLAAMDEAGASAATLDDDMYPVSMRGLKQWQARQEDKEE